MLIIVILYPNNKPSLIRKYNFYVYLAFEVNIAARRSAHDEEVVGG